MFAKKLTLVLGLAMMMAICGCARNRCCTRPAIVNTVPIAPAAPCPTCAPGGQIPSGPGAPTPIPAFSSPVSQQGIFVPR